MTDDIVAFIRARLNEDEARVHNDIEWWFNECAISATNHEGIDIAGADDYIRPFIDPARVLRGVEAKRRIVAMWTTWLDGYTGDEWRSPEHVQDTLRLLASEWSSHPGYRQEWMW